MNIDIDSPLDSYSLAAMARTEDIISFLINDLAVVGSKAAFKNVLYGVRLIVEGKNKLAAGDVLEFIPPNLSSPILLRVYEFEDALTGNISTSVI